MTENHSKIFVRGRFRHRILTLIFWLIRYFSWVGGWMGEIEDEVHFSPPKAEIGAELCNKSICLV